MHCKKCIAYNKYKKLGCRITEESSCKMFRAGDGCRLAKHLVVNALKEKINNGEFLITDIDWPMWKMYMGNKIKNDTEE